MLYMMLLAVGCWLLLQLLLVLLLLLLVLLLLLQLLLVLLLLLMVLVTPQISTLLCTGLTPPIKVHFCLKKVWG